VDVFYIYSDRTKGYECVFEYLVIALSDVDDVRPVLEYYSQFDDPIAAFKEKQRLLQVALPSSYESYK